MSDIELRNRHRRLHDYFNIEKSSLRDVIYAVSPTVTASDASRVLHWLDGNIDTYRSRHRNGRRAFKKWAVTWIRFVTGIILVVREMAPALTAAAEAAVPGLSSGDYALAAKRVENHVVELLNTDVQSLLEWAKDKAVYEIRGLAEWPNWYQCDINRRCVYKGLWRCLNQCGGLGLGESDDEGRNSVIETLASDVWLWSYENAGTLAEGPVPPGARLLERAYWVARQWKTNQLRDKKDFVAAEDFITLAAADQTKFYDEPTPPKRSTESDSREDPDDYGFDDPDALVVAEHQEEDVPLAA